MVITSLITAYYYCYSFLGAFTVRFNMFGVQYALQKIHTKTNLTSRKGSKLHRMHNFIMGILKPLHFIALLKEFHFWCAQSGSTTKWRWTTSDKKLSPFPWLDSSSTTWNVRTQGSTLKLFTPQENYPKTTMMIVRPDTWVCYCIIASTR